MKELTRKKLHFVPQKHSKREIFNYKNEVLITNRKKARLTSLVLQRKIFCHVSARTRLSLSASGQSHKYQKMRNFIHSVIQN